MSNKKKRNVLTSNQILFVHQTIRCRARFITDKVFHQLGELTLLNVLCCKLVQHALHQKFHEYPIWKVTVQSTDDITTPSVKCSIDLYVSMSVTTICDHCAQVHH